MIRGKGETLTPDDLSPVAWHISTRSSGGSGQCVEAGPVRDGSGRVAVRHSHHPHGGVLVSTTAEWSAFLAALKRGTYDSSG